MYIQEITNQTLLDKYPIIELKVRGTQTELERFACDIQDVFDLAHDDWEPSLNMLVMTFDYKKGEQTLNQIRTFTKDYIKRLHTPLTV